MQTSTSILTNKEPRLNNGVYLLSSYFPANTHEQIYLEVRAKEARLLSDDMVRILPDLPSDFPNANEWQLRKQTATLFCNYIRIKQKPLIMLDLGCGNGWFSAKLASISESSVFGLDLNLPELQQAERNFGTKSLRFFYGNIFDQLFISQSFDIVVFNASIQYFPRLSELFTILFPLLKSDGEIHILDSPFYNENELPNARKRTIDYYSSIGFPEMVAHYFHHSYQELNRFSPITLNKKPFWKRIVTKHLNPFPWVMIRK